MAAFGALLWSGTNAGWLRGEIIVPGLPPGTRVIAVTTLNADGPGSLTDALMASGPRLIVFEVGGVIDLRSQSADRPYRILSIGNGNVVIAGETAPSPGIHLVGAPLEIRASNIVVRHISVYTGTQFPYYLSSDAIKINASPTQVARNLLFENNGFYWAIDETGETWTDPNGFQVGQISDVIFRKNIFAEALHSTLHPKGPHSNGFLISHGAQRVFFDRNLFASNFRRNPWITGDTTVVLQNNVIYNPGRHAAIFSGGASYGGVPVTGAETTAIGNVCIAGPNTQAWLTGDSDGQPKMFYADPAAVAPNTRLYLQDNVFLARGGDEIGRDWQVFLDETGTIITATAPMTWAPLPPAVPSNQVVNEVLGVAGPRPLDTVRPVTSRLLEAVRNGTSRIIASEADVGGYPSLVSASRPFNVTTLLPIPQGYLDGGEGSGAGGGTEGGDAGGGGTGGGTGGSTEPEAGSNLVGHWRLDNPFLGADTSGEANDLTTFGSPETAAENGADVGVFREADGDYLRGEPSDSLNVDGGSFTVSAWFKPMDAAPGTGDLHGIVAKSRYGRFGNATFQLYHENDVVRFTIGDRTPGPPPNTDPALTKADIVVSPTSIQSGEWSHAVAWYDSGADSISISVNGEEPVTVPATFTSGFANTDDNGYLLIGSLYGHALFDGMIDDVRMWKKILLPAERENLYTNSPHYVSGEGGTGGSSGGEGGGADTVILDDRADLFTGFASAKFRLYRGIGYGGTIRYFPAISGSRQTPQRDPVHGLWFFETLSPNTEYDFYATWPGRTGFTTDVPLILSRLGFSPVVTTVDQSLPPRADLVENGVAWQYIGRIRSSSDGMAMIQINALGTALDRESYTVMDAMMAKKVQ